MIRSSTEHFVTSPPAFVRSTVACEDGFSLLHHERAIAMHYPSDDPFGTAEVMVDHQSRIAFGSRLKDAIPSRMREEFAEEDVTALGLPKRQVWPACVTCPRT